MTFTRERAGAIHRELGRGNSFGQPRRGRQSCQSSGVRRCFTARRPCQDPGGRRSFLQQGHDLAMSFRACRAVSLKTPPPRAASPSSSCLGMKRSMTRSLLPPAAPIRGGCPVCTRTMLSDGCFTILCSMSTISVRRCRRNSAGPSAQCRGPELSQHHAHGRDGAGIARLHGLFVGIVSDVGGARLH